MADYKPKLNGGCACKAIRYRIEGMSGFSFHCQCRDCQYMSGTGHTSTIIFKADDVKVDGELSWYERQAPSGNSVKSGFCNTCGTGVMNQNSGYPDNLFVLVGTLDDPSLFQPTKIIYRDEGHAWDFLDPEADRA